MMSFRVKIGVKVTVLTLLLLPMVAVADEGWDISRLTTDGSQQNGPIVWGNKIVWTDWRGPQALDVWGYDISTQEEYPIVEGPGFDRAAAFERNKLVYNEYFPDTGETNIWWLNLRNNKKKLIAGGEGSRSATDMSGKWVVYIEGYGSGTLYAYNVKTGERVEITDNAARPRISRGKIVWYFNRGGGLNGVRGYNLKSRSFFSLTDDNSGNSQLPDIHRNKVVWAEEIDGTSFLMMKNLRKGETTIVYETEDGLVSYPTIMKRSVAWRQVKPLFPEGGGQAFASHQDVWVKNLKSGETTQLTDDGQQQVSPSGVPSLYRGLVTWMSWVTGGGDIYFGER